MGLYVHNLKSSIYGGLMIFKIIEKIMLAFVNVFGYFATLLSNRNYIALFACFAAIGFLVHLASKIFIKHKN